MAKAFRHSPVEQVWLLLEEKQIPYNVKRAASIARGGFQPAVEFFNHC